MNDIEWRSSNYFKKDENWGDASLMKFSFISVLEKYRDFIKTPIIIICGTQGIHEPKSKHSDGMAVDCVIPGPKLFDSWINALRFPFTGIGYYPLWEYQGIKTGGLHLEYNIFAAEMPKKFWLGLGTDHSNTKYYAMNYDNLSDSL